MQIALLKLTYLVPLERILQSVAQHRTYLEKYYQSGHIMFSGMLSTQQGGLIVMRFTREEELQQLIAGDPFVQENLVDYEIHLLDVKRMRPELSNLLESLPIISGY